MEATSKHNKAHIIYINQNQMIEIGIPPNGSTISRSFFVFGWLVRLVFFLIQFRPRSSTLSSYDNSNKNYVEEEKTNTNDYENELAVCEIAHTTYPCCPVEPFNGFLKYFIQ